MNSLFTSRVDLYITYPSIFNSLSMRHYLTVLFLLTLYSCTAQQMVFAVNAGVGDYDMKDLELFLKQSSGQTPISLALTEDFPPYFFYEASCFRETRYKLFYGALVTYGSTGGREAYRDYSGYLHEDLLLHYFDFGLPVGLVFHARENLVVHLDLQPTYTMTRSLLNVEEHVGAYHESGRLHFHSGSFAAQPGVSLLRKFQRMALQLNASYYITAINGKLYSKEYDGGYLINRENDDPLYAGWNGVRISIGASLTLAQGSHSNEAATPQ